MSRFFVDSGGIGSFRSLSKRLYSSSSALTVGLFHRQTAEEKLKFIEETVKECCPDIGEDELSFQTAVVLFAAMVVGPDMDNLTAMTGYPREFVGDIAFRARDTGLWIDGRVCYVHWFKGDSVRFVPILCDILVIEGKLTRRRRKDGKFLYSCARPS